MIRTPWFKLTLLLVCAILLSAQEQPDLPKNTVPMQEVVVVGAVPVDSSIENQQKQQPAVIAAIESASVQPESIETKEGSPQVAQPQPTIQITQKIQQPIQDSPQTDPAPPQPTAAEPQNPVSSQGSLQNLTEQQKKQLLHEQSIRAQLHSNQELKLSDLANMTAQQQQQMERRFAEESRAAYQRAQKEIAERQAKEKQQIQKLLKQAKLSRTQEIRIREQRKITALIDESKKGLIRLGSDYLFDMDPSITEDFMISLPVAQKLGFSIQIYSNYDGVYAKNKDVDNEKPLSLIVYENNHNIVYQNTFHFNDAHLFDGNADSTYTIRFENADKHRLISMRLTNVLERSQIQTKLKASDLTSHSARSQFLYTATKQKFFGLNQKSVVQTSNRMKLAQEIKTYYIYNCIEILIFIVTVLVQIEMIRRLLGSSSIV